MPTRQSRCTADSRGLPIWVKVWRLMQASSVVIGVAIVILGAAAPARAEVRDLTKVVGGTTVRYKVVLPYMFDPAKAYPAVLVFGGGPQTMDTVDRTLARNF